MKTYVVLKESAINPYRMCLLGEGSSPDQAMTDAYGPKPWPRSSRSALVKEVDANELEELRQS